MWQVVLLILIVVICLAALYSYRSFDVPSGIVVIVTGASSGIGESIAHFYAKRGAKLVLAARRRDRLEEVARVCDSLGAAEVFVVETDVADVKQCEYLVTATVQKFGAINRLFMSAGVSMHAEFSDFELTVFEKQMDINFRAPVHLTKHALPHLAKSKGKICAISSILGVGIAPRNTAYCASKHALNAFFDSLRPEVAPKGVSVSVVCPGPVDTEILQNLDGKSGSTVGMNLSNSEKLMLWSAQAAGNRCAASTERGVAYDGFPIHLWWFVRFRTVLPWLCDAVFAYFYTHIDMQEKSAAEVPAKKQQCSVTETATTSLGDTCTGVRETGVGIWKLPSRPPTGLESLTGPGRLPLESLLVYVALTVPAWCVCGHAFFTNIGWSVPQYFAASFLAGDLVAGVVIFASSTGKRWWHRSERRTVFEQMKYVAVVGIHPFLVALLFREGPLVERAIWYAFSYGYLGIAVMLITCSPLHYRRLFAACLFMLALMIEVRLVSYTPLFEWVLPLYYFKYLCCYPVREEPYRPNTGEHVKDE